MKNEVKLCKELGIDLIVLENKEDNYGKKLYLHKSESKGVSVQI